MSLIQCEEYCKFQEEGYCRLENPGNVNCHNNDCPYFKAKLSDNRNGLFKTSDSEQL